MKDLMPGRKGTGTSQPPAELDRRPDDLELPWQLFQAIKRIDKVSDRILQNNPGTLRLRRYAEGEPICIQGDQGWTAFRILSADDFRSMRGLCDGTAIKTARALASYAKASAEAATDQKAKDKLLKDVKDNEALAKKFEGWLPELKPFLGTIPPTPPEGTVPPSAAFVYVESGAQAQAPRGMFSWLWGAAPARRKPRVINIDAPTVVDYGTRKAEMPEGTLFGEWSCQYGTPRSATIAAAREIYVVEMLYNVLDFVFKDAEYQKDTQEAYKKNILDGHLANLSFLSDLKPEQLEEVRLAAELCSFRDGQIVFDRGDAPDHFYIVRRGIIKVLINDWPLLTNDDFVDPSKLSSMAGEAGSYLKGKLGTLPAEKGTPLTKAVNAGLKKKDFTTVKDKPAPALKAILEVPAMKSALEDHFPPKQDDWSDQDWRRYNRLVLETAAPGALLPVVREGVRPGQQGPEDIMAYLTAGEYFGELGAVSGAPRTATCVAYVHPRPSAAEEVDATGEKWRKTEERVELVRLPRDMLLQLMKKYDSVKKEIDKQIAARKENTRKMVQMAGADDPHARLSDKYQQLGLVQGQKLMLIDLERCTRCDECVQACIATHKDGLTRLHLDGPRFGKYLVPVSCRACRDPVCMIGCPVGSIRRGNNLEMVIEDWCSGCQLCAKNCPYGSIQMHDLGLLAQEGYGWEIRGSGAWRPARLPLVADADLEATLALLGGGRVVEARREFELDGSHVTGEGGLKLVIDSIDEAVKIAGEKKAAKVVGFLPITLNGKALPPEGWLIERGQYYLELTGAERAKWFNKGKNTLSIKVTAPVDKRGTLLQVALDAVRASGSVIPLRAAVCDQCSTLPDQVQACVHACPHDAAMRVDAWNDFPTR